MSLESSRDEHSDELILKAGKQTSEDQNLSQNNSHQIPPSNLSCANSPISVRFPFSVVSVQALRSDLAMAADRPATASDADEEEEGGGGEEDPNGGVAAAAAAIAQEDEEEEEDDDDDGDGDDDREDRRDLLPAPSSLVPRPRSSLRHRLLAETEARKAAQASRYDLQIAFSRLKTFAFDAVRQRDDAVRLRSEAESSKEELERQLDEAVRWSNVLVQQRNSAIKERDEALRQRNDAFRSLEEASLHKDIAIHGRDNSRSDMESAAKLLVAGADLITSKVSSIKKFPIALPRSSSHTGLSAIAYGFTRRSEEIVNELLSQYEIVVKERSAFSEHTDHQNYQAAIKLSELESKIEVLEGNLSKKTSEFENCLNIIAEKEEKISEIELFASKKKAEDDNENLRLRNALKLAETKAENVNLSSNELSKLISKLHEMVANHATVFFPAHLHPSYGASSVHKANDSIRDCIDKSNEILKLFSKLAVTWEEQLDLRKKALEDTEGTISRLIVEKKEITNFLESAIAAKQEMLEAFSKLSLDSNNNLNTITKNRDTRLVTISGTANSLDEELKAETASRIAALEDSLKMSRQDIFELQRLLAVARGEVEWLRITLERQAKELLLKEANIKDLEEKKLLTEEIIYSLERDLVAAEEGALIWKQAAAKEVKSGALMRDELERCQEQTAAFKEEIQKLNNALEDSNSKLHSKEEMANTAIAARRAAEHSLQIADDRALELRKRIEDMTRQFEILDATTDDGMTSIGWLDACWPYKWPRTRTKSNQSGRLGAEMEKLLEPFV